MPIISVANNFADEHTNWSVCVDTQPPFDQGHGAFTGFKLQSTDDRLIAAGSVLDHYQFWER